MQCKLNQWTQVLIAFVIPLLSLNVVRVHAQECRSISSFFPGEPSTNELEIIDYFDGKLTAVYHQDACGLRHCELRIVYSVNSLGAGSCYQVALEDNGYIQILTDTRLVVRHGRSNEAVVSEYKLEWVPTNTGNKTIPIFVIKVN